MANEKRLIDANPIVQFIMDGLNNPDKMKALGHDAIEILAEIEYAPTVDAVEVKHGRWIEKVDMVASYLADCEETFYECSVCNSANFGESPYCPNCGAKMDGDRNG